MYLGANTNILDIFGCFNSCDVKFLKNITKRTKVKADFVNYFSGFWLTLDTL